MQVWQQQIIEIVLQELKICAAIIDIFHLIPSASQKFMDPLMTFVLKGEKDLFIEVNFSSHRPNVSSFLLLNVYLLCRICELLG